LCAIVLTCQKLSAGVLDNRDFIISQDYSHSEQNNPAVAAGSNGKFAVVWVDHRNNQADIYCRLYDSGVVEVGGNFPLNDDDAGAWQFEPDLDSDRYGNYFAVWRDYRNSVYPFDPDIFYQCLDSAGFVGANINISVETPDSSHQSPAIAVSEWGKKLISWTDLRHYNWDLFLQMVDTDGNFVDSNLQVNDDDAAAPQHEPDLAVSISGWFVIVWYDNRMGQDDIYIQKFDSSGIPVGGNVRVNDDGTSSKQKFPCVAIGGDDVVTIAWVDWRNGEYPDNPDIFGQRLDSDFNRLGGNFLINTDGYQTAQRNPEVAADRQGNACVVWSDSMSMDWNVRGQLFDNAGSRNGSIFTVNLDTEGRQLNPDLDMDGRNLYFVWADDRNGNYDIYGRVYQYSDPSLVATPAGIDITKEVSDPDPAPIKTILTYAGIGEINYRLDNALSWLTLSKSSGTTPDSFNISINSSDLDLGIHLGQVYLINDEVNDTVGSIPVVLTITEPVVNIDSVVIFPAQGEQGGSLQSPFYLHNVNTIYSGTLHFDYDKAMIQVDSVGQPIGPSIIDNRIVAVDTAGGYFTVTIPVNPEKAGIGAGDYHLGDIYLTANDSLTGITLIEASSNVDSFYLTLGDSSHSIPTLDCGDIEISIPLSADDGEENALPCYFYLEQNYPNPFNGATAISFGLKRSGSVRLEVFNILGQLVDTPVDQYLSAGRHETSWNGRDTNGREMATGIYFYRLSTSEFNAVKKLVYLK
jgi:hypothetical protein